MKQINISELAHFTPKQKEAEDAVKENKYTLYGGAMGGGKSYWLRWMMIRLLLHWGYYQQKNFGRKSLKHVMVGLFCENYPALMDRQISKIKYEFPGELGTYNATEHNFVLGRKWGGGILAFRNLDDASKYQSAEFAAIGVDELTKNEKDTFDFLRTRLRWPGIEHPKFLGATNPGSIGSDWVRKMWIDREYPAGETEKSQFKYVHARAADNPHLAADYVASLQGLPEDMRKAFLEGSWDVFEGQYFKEWNRDLHVCRPKPLLAYYRKFIAIDYGYAAPSCALWMYLDGDGVANVYRELYGPGFTYETLAKEISALTPENEKIEYMVADPAIWAKKGENSNELSGAELFSASYRAARSSLPLLIKANNDRIVGWNTVREYMKAIAGPDGQKMAKLQIWENCVNTIKTLPKLIYDDRNPEDLNSDGEDHAADALRYGLMSRPSKSPTLYTGPGMRAGRLLGNTKSPVKENQDSFE
jgi:phage terminase large subunit